jgi:hypothetical protein
MLNKDHSAPLRMGLQPCEFHLGREFLDRLDEVLVAVSISCHELSEEGDNVEGVLLVHPIDERTMSMRGRGEIKEDGSLTHSLKSGF